MKNLTTLLILSTVGLAITAATAVALPYNTRPEAIQPPYTGETSLQDVFDLRTTMPDGVSSVSAANDQSNVALWNPSDDNSSNAFLVSMMQTSAEGTIGIYNQAGLKVSFATFPGYTLGGEFTFRFDDSGNLYGSSYSDLLQSNFGRTFGFYWEVGNNTYYTEDDKNGGGKAHALTYLLEHGTEVETSPSSSGLTTNTATANGDDWIIAFEDGTDFDFQDAVFYVEDIAPVPEPGTLLLLGSGLAGLAAARRRKKA